MLGFGSPDPDTDMELHSGGFGEGLGGFCVSNWRRWELWGVVNQGALKGICRG